MAGHYQISLELNNHIVDMLFDFTEKVEKIGRMIPFQRYYHNDKQFMRLTDRYEPCDTDVITISPTTLFDSEGEIDTICVTEIHINNYIQEKNNRINKIYCVL